MVPLFVPGFHSYLKILLISRANRDHLSTNLDLTLIEAGVIPFNDQFHYFRSDEVNRNEWSTSVVKGAKEGTNLRIAGPDFP